MMYKNYYNIIAVALTNNLFSNQFSWNFFTYDLEQC